MTEVEGSDEPEIQVISIAWHPIRQFLAVGYETGQLVLWNHEEGESFEGIRSHHSEVVMLEWSNCGNFLTSGDSMGLLIVWKCDSQGNLQTEAVHDLKDPACSVIFIKQSDNDKSDERLVFCWVYT